MGEFLMPSLGADMEDGTLVEWEKRTGEAVRRGDVIAVVETQKGAIEIEAYEDGVLESILVDTGTTVPVGTPLALIGGAGGAPTAEAPVTVRRSATAAAGQPGAGAGAAGEREHPSARGTADVGEAPIGSVRVPVPDESAPRADTPGSSPRRRVTPLARRRAEAAGIDVSTLTGSGPGGALTGADVEAALASAPAAGPAAGGLPAGMREAIARSMARSKREIPHYYLAHTIDLSAATAALQRLNAERPPAERVLLGALLIGAVARAARAHPLFNGHRPEELFVPSTAVHVGVAVRLRGGGLVAPALHDADRLGPDALMGRLRDLVERVRAGRFRASELTDPTLTVSSIGERGVETLYGVIHPPQVCLVGFGAPRPAPQVRDGQVLVCPRLSMTLAADHRVSDGHAGSRFLIDIARRLESPEAWLGEVEEETPTRTIGTTEECTP